VYRGARCDSPPLPDHKNFLQATLYEKVRSLPFSSNNCKIQQCLMVFFIGLLRLKSPGEIASGMTLASPNAFENQLQAV